MNETIKYQNIHGNRKHKDSLFRKVFRKKKDLLDLYNAINGTNYENEDELEINTLDNVLYMSVKNDISCIVGCTINLYEHQSSYNPNMPLRGLIYFAQLYNIYTEKRKLNLFSSTLQKIPTPQFVVFYNGLKNEPDRKVLKLSDAFMSADGCLECTAVMLNINYGNNRELMEKCRRLEEYAIFIAMVRKYATDERIDLGNAITLAIDECIEKEILSDILKEERTEVFMYILEAFDKELYEKDLKADAYEDGVAVGLEAGKVAGLRASVENVMKNLNISAEKACEIVGISMEIYKDALENVEQRKEKNNA